MSITRAEFRSQVAYEFDSNTLETTVSASPFQFGDDFVGAGHTAGVPVAGTPSAGYPWVKKIVGAGPPTVAIVSNGVGGLMANALVATSEAEEASLYFNDSLCIDMTRIGQGEWRSALTVPPSAAGVQAAIGFGSAWVGSPTTLARYLLFIWTANNTLTIAGKDGNGSTFSGAYYNGTAASGVATDTNQHVYRIDWSNNLDCGFYLDGNRINAVGSMVWTATAGANSMMQPWATVYKPSGTGLATLTLDKVDAFNNR